MHILERGFSSCWWNWGRDLCI